MQCSSCDCVWDSDGFYHTADGVAIQPCKVCRCDTASIYYLNHAESIRQKRKHNYHKDIEASRAYDRERKRRARLSVLSGCQS